jgi:hypothetical protein
MSQSISSQSFSRILNKFRFNFHNKTLFLLISQISRHKTMSKTNLGYCIWRYYLDYRDPTWDSFSPTILRFYITSPRRQWPETQNWLAITLNLRNFSLFSIKQLKNAEFGYNFEKFLEKKFNICKLVDSRLNFHQKIWLLRKSLRTTPL